MAAACQRLSRGALRLRWPRRAEAEEPAPLPVVDPGRWQIAFEGRLSAYGGEDTLWDCFCLERTIGPDYGAGIGIDITREMPSGWLASFGIRYGRSNSTEDSFFSSYPLPTGYAFYEGRASHQEQHAIVDFAVSRDVGLGLFGNSGGTSTLTAGVRVAHFRADTDVALAVGAYYSSPPGSYSTALPGGIIKRSFTGLGPRIAWNGSVPVARNPAFSFDWGVAGALLFGRQKTEFSATFSGYVVPTYAGKKSVVVPNIEAFAALSWQIPDVPGRFTAGYRVDAYFNVIDGGFDEPESVDRIIHGPFARFTIELDGP
jgi:hypothetical protein